MKCTILHSNGFLLRNINRWEVCITVFCSIIRINLNFSNLLSYIEPNSMQIFNLGIYFTIYHEPDGLIPYVCQTDLYVHKLLPCPSHILDYSNKIITGNLWSAPELLTCSETEKKFLSGPERSYSSLSTLQIILYAQIIILDVQTVIC